ncbi:MAG TPA: twin-arginine translocase TatA/TatE family subunit [Chthonomonadaceae bacterium]|nr:twin-arginine translocase TatA/TatE family subunit [Chthonomonadaceae bacterium]
MNLAFINSTNDLLLIALVILVLFGANKIPEIMRGLGQGMRELKRGMSGEEEPSRQAEAEREAGLRAKIEEEVRRRMEAERQRERER